MEKLLATPLSSPDESSDVVDTQNAKHRVNRRTGREYINQYELHHKLGAGAYGVVLLAKDLEKNNMNVALKILNKKQLMKSKNDTKAQNNVLADLRREIAIMKKLDHQNVVKLYEVIDDPNSDNLYLAMEYLPGGPCWKKDSPTFQESLCRAYMRDIIMGLEYCHDNDIIHHDIKPDNILIGADHKLKICDFGVSMLVPAENDEERCVRGTPPFLAPEIINGAKTHQPYAGRPVDVWAVGITLYMFLYGFPPFKGKTIPDTFNCIVRNPLRFPNKLTPELMTLIGGILDKNPATRLTIAQIKEDPWMTMGGAWPFPVTNNKIDVNEEEMDKAITTLLPLSLIIGIKLKMGRHAENARKNLAVSRASMSQLEQSESSPSQTNDEEGDNTNSESRQSLSLIPQNTPEDPSDVQTNPDPNGPTVPEVEEQRQQNSPQVKKSGCCTIF
ncbi:putative serine/threonine protein kinase [Blattamonas nauphoetae]|uniref:Serine/threonine protein kinase n=1 Tax=Blattamonas nauphoetae TaxID=2049346 RepID=A0ABQ9WU98_9EUKA|nr:putative serine/threonine protein kinase [Blattamonas nauphoetae]